MPLVLSEICNMSGKPSSFFFGMGPQLAVLLEATLRRELALGLLIFLSEAACAPRLEAAI
jgi:hypothetical protein